MGERLRAGEVVSLARFVTGGLLSASLVFALSGCSGVSASHWLITDQGTVSFGPCYRLTFDSLTVTTMVNVGDDFTGDPELIELSGPAVSLAAGETIDLSKVAAGWNAAAPLDMSADWYQLDIDAYYRAEQVLWASVDHADLVVGEWMQLPEPGFNVSACDRL